MRNCAAFILSVIVGVIASWSIPSISGRAFADPPAICCNQPGPDQFTIAPYGNLDQYNPVSAKVRNEGIIRWAYKVEPGCSDGMGPIIGRAMGNIYDQTGVVFVYVESGPVDLTIRANCGVSLYAVCGQVTGVNCLGRGFPYNLDIDLNTDIYAYYDQSQVAVVLHELWGHALQTADEGYCKGAGNPAGCTGQFAPVPGYMSVMNTGPDSRHYLGNLEAAMWGRTQGTPAANRTGRTDSFVYFCGVDARALYVDLYGSGSSYRYIGSVWLRDIVKSVDGCYGLQTAGYVRGDECPAIRLGNYADWKRVEYRRDRVLC